MAQNINSSTMNGTSTRFVTGAGDESWEARESQRQRELEEARARAAQMEKTMRWWSDCTTSWRSKWSAVRNERNKAREESKQLRASLEQSLKESNSYKREKNELEQQIQQLKKEMEKIHNCLISHVGQFNKTGLESDEPEREINCSPDILLDGLKNVNSEDGLVTKARAFSDEKELNIENNDLEIEEYVLQGALPKTFKSDDNTDEDKIQQQLEKTSLILSSEDEIYAQKVRILQTRLDDAQKTINSERGEKILLLKAVEKMRKEMEDYRIKSEEMRSAKQEAVRELLTMEQTHRAEQRISSNSLQEEINARESVERRMAELRAELERLQSENAREWELRERLETEKTNFERENKKLRSELQDLVQNERFDRRGQRPNSGDLEVRQLQQELMERNKEITELRHSQSKMKKMLSEANTEINHAVRRAEQYETEVKRLRSRVEELKKQLTNAEDELDSACNHLRRIQRTNDELSGNAEGLDTQIVNFKSSRLPREASTSAKDETND